MRIKREFDANINQIEAITDFIRDSLKGSKIKEKDIIKAVLTTEEAAGCLINHLPGKEFENAKIFVRINALLGYVNIELSAPGIEFSLAKNMGRDVQELSKDNDYENMDDIQESLSNIIMKSLADNIKYSHRHDFNYISMDVIRSKHAFLYRTLGAIALGIIFGIAFGALAAPDMVTAVNSNLLVPVKTMYMNALKMVVAPVVFFSIISCIVQFADLSALGRIGGKIIGTYLFTTCVAIAVGIGLFTLFQPGDASLAESLVADATSITSQTMEVSIKDTIVGIIPSDIINPFLKANMLQLIFMAVLIGIATGLIGKYSRMLTDLFTACNDLFLRIISMIIKAMPIAVFCSMSSMMLTMGIKTIVSVLEMFLIFLLGLLCMMFIYCLLMIIVGRIDPRPFVRKYFPYMLQVFSLNSSNAAIPLNMEACEKMLGISQRIFSLSIPLGATLNMDGACIYMPVFTLALAKTYGIEITGGALLSMVISIIVLSVGAPGIPGSGLICLSVLLAQLGIPVEAVGLVMGIDSLCGMFRSMSNCLGDVAVSTMVAKTEKELDMQVYNG